MAITRFSASCCAARGFAKPFSQRYSDAEAQPANAAISTCVNPKAALFLASVCAWNWALAEWHKQYAAHKADASLPKPSEGALRKQLNAIKREKFPWMLEVTKCVPQEAIRALGVAYGNWWASLSGKRKGLNTKRLW